MSGLRGMLCGVAVIFAAVGMGCSSAGGGVAGKALQIRVMNAGTVPLEDVRINFVGKVESFGTIAPGAVTDYHGVEKAYSYAYIETAVGGKKAVLQPVDFVGETLLPPGRYTWTLAGNPDGADEYARLIYKGSKRD